MDFKKKLILMISIFAVVSAVLLTALIFSGFDIKKRIKQVSELRGEINFQTRAIQNLALLRQDKTEADIYSAELSGVLINRDQLVNFSKDLSIMANQNKIDLGLTIGVETQKTENSPGKTAFTLSVKGSFDDLINFLRTLENSKYFINLNSIDFTRQEDKFKALINGEVFSF